MCPHTEVFFAKVITMGEKQIIAEKMWATASFSEIVKRP